MIRIGQEIQCLPYADFLEVQNDFCSCLCIWASRGSLIQKWTEGEFKELVIFSSRHFWVLHNKHINRYPTYAFWQYFRVIINCSQLYLKYCKIHCTQCTNHNVLNFLKLYNRFVSWNQISSRKMKDVNFFRSYIMLISLTTLAWHINNA